MPKLHPLLWGVLAFSAIVPAQAQQAQWPAPAQDTIQQRWPDDPPAQPALPKQDQRAKSSRAAPPGTPEEGGAPAKKPAPQPARAVACTGAFAKDSNHLKLAQAYGAQNVAFGDVDGPDGAKLKASVVFPKDPKRRLEVLWQNEASRSDTSLVAINGQSTWTAPRGLKLGMTLAALEKLNGKPFKLSGFEADDATVADWQGGALASLPGGCKAGVRLAIDGKAAAAARSAVAGAAKEFMSSDAAIRAVSPKISEILIGY